MQLHPQMIEKEGRKEFVVLPFEEYQKLTELLQDYEDLKELREAKQASQGEKGISLAQVMSEFGMK